MKKLLTFISTLLISVSSSTILLVGHAFAAGPYTCTWTGAVNSDFNTSGNWTGCNGSVPQSGDADTLVFPYGTGVTNKVLNNNLPSDTSIDEIDFTGTSSGETNYTLNGNSLNFDGGIGIYVSASGTNISPTISLDIVVGDNMEMDSGGQTLTLSGVLSDGANPSAVYKIGSGTVVLSGSNTFSDWLIVDGGTLEVTNANSLGDVNNAIWIDDTADLFINSCSTSITISHDIEFFGVSSDTTGDFPTPKLKTSAGNCTSGASFDETYGYSANSNLVTLSGMIDFNDDVTFASLSQTKLDGTINGDHINMLAGYAGQLTVDSQLPDVNSSLTPNGIYSPPAFTKTLSNNLPSNSLNILGNTNIIVTGTRGDVTVDGGTLKGTGTVGDISLISGVVAPGMSPGILNTGNLVYTGGSYQAELGGTSAGKFDQTNVTGTVDLGSATTLNVSLYNSFKPAAGNSFTIVKNDGSDAVTGTFKGLAEGATFKVSGYTFKVTYAGGDGNDVVITVVSKPPAAPNTGFRVVTRNPALAVILLCLIAPGFAFAASRSYRLNSKR